MRARMILLMRAPVHGQPPDGSEVRLNDFLTVRPMTRGDLQWRFGPDRADRHLDNVRTQSPEVSHVLMPHHLKLPIGFTQSETQFRSLRRLGLSATKRRKPKLLCNAQFYCCGAAAFALYNCGDRRPCSAQMPRVSITPVQRGRKPTAIPI